MNGSNGYQIFEVLENANNEELFLKNLQTVANNLGFEYYAYGVRATFPFSEQKTVVINNYPDSWNTRYQSNNYINIDPVVHMGLKSTKYFCWEDAALNNRLDFWEEAKAFDINYGFTQSHIDMSGRVGMLSLSSSNPLKKHQILSDKIPHIIWLCQITHAMLPDILLPEQTLAIDFMLTKREIEVMRWTAEGKTSVEIAEQMFISDRTVNFHINNVIKKLSVSNKTAATVKAVVLNLL